MKYLLIDCDDSFTLNIADNIRKNNIKVDVISYKKININTISQYKAIILSPGPNQPTNIPVLEAIVSKYKLKIPILGICLGHQAIGLHFGHELIKSQAPMHGLSPKIKILQEHPIFSKINKNSFTAMRYNSLSIASSSNSELNISCVDENNEIMGFTHPTLPIITFQFHPESIGTSQGGILVQNWIKFITFFWDKKPK